MVELSPPEVEVLDSLGGSVVLASLVLDDVGSTSVGSDGPVLDPEVGSAPPELSVSLIRGTQVPARPEGARSPYRRPVSHSGSGKLQYPVDSQAPPPPPELQSSDVSQKKVSR